VAGFPDIETLIPHRRPMRLIDRVLDADPAAMTCAGVVRQNDPFLRDGRLDASGLLEWMAQTMAALVTWRDPRPGTMGYLVGSRQVELPDVPVHAGDELIVRVREDGTLGDYASFHGEVTRDGVLVCRGNLKVMRVREGEP
jgi:predicted hotdog family 3-hydroxylacyl-ACP dehydratase